MPFHRILHLLTGSPDGGPWRDRLILDNGSYGAARPASAAFDGERRWLSPSPTQTPTAGRDHDRDRDRDRDLSPFELRAVNDAAPAARRLIVFIPVLALTLALARSWEMESGQRLTVLPRPLAGRLCRLLIE